MTLTDSALLGGTTTSGFVDRSNGSVREVRAVAGDDRDMHLLRLSLDLQLDAMLLVLGASAMTAPDAGIPWRRWLDEDVELAWELATTALAARASLPPTLGSDLANADPDTIADDLLARYESMCGLMSDLLTRDVDGRPEWHDNVRQALAHCQERVIEIRDHQHERRLASGRSGATSPGAGPGPSGAASRHTTHGSQVYLPGELLG